MCLWQHNIQRMIDEIDACIRREDGEAATLTRLAGKLSYSESYVSRKFRELSGMRLREYVRGRRLAFALRDLRESGAGILDIALKYGYASGEAFARAFKAAYGLSPGEYRLRPVPVALRTVLRPMDCYLLGADKTGAAEAEGEVKTYFVTVSAHKFLHIRNYESIGYHCYSLDASPGMENHFPERAISPEDILMEKETEREQEAARALMMERLREALATLTPRQASCLHARFWEEKPFKEIAEAEGFTTSAAIVTVRNAIIKLQKYYIKRGWMKPPKEKAICTKTAPPKRNRKKTSEKKS